MPAMADITVKKADEATNITYTAKVASAGDKTPALWRCTSVGSAPGHNPALSLQSRSNGPNTARRLDFSFTYPQTATAADGSIQIVNLLNVNGSVLVPSGMTQTLIDEGVAQCMNLLASTLVKSSCKDGFSPT